MLEEGLYSLCEAMPMEAIANTTGTLKIWHDRLGHLGKENQKRFFKRCHENSKGKGARRNNSL